MDYQEFFQRRIDGLKRHGNYRRFAELERSPGKFPHVSLAGGREVTVWCSNDYLGMGQNAQVIAAMHAALDQNGAGAGGTRNISGTNTIHVALERALADLHGKESALLFNSGYMSNWASLSTIASQTPGCVVFSDAFNHASMIEGIRHSRARCEIFAHNDPIDLASRLAALPLETP
jgi:5-aminolevulinate synthase